jgi:diguanylate cyclase (GGDEF)-like protein
VVLIPLLWIYNGGLSGSIPFFYLFNTCLSAILLSRLRYRLILGIQIAILFILLFVEFNYPDSIRYFPTQTAAFFDKSIFLAVVSFTMFMMLIKIMKEYHQTITKLSSAHEELKKSNDVLYQNSITDELTGLYNRRHILELLSGLTENGRRQRENSVIMFDIDHFKAINDTYGHKAGDLVLIQIGRLLKENFRRTDFIGRIGGEEFLVLMPDTRLETAMSRAEKMRKTIADFQWDYPGLSVTVSGGIFDFRESESFDTVLNNADIALYQAKSSGRNLIKSYR